MKDKYDVPDDAQPGNSGIIYCICFLAWPFWAKLFLAVNLFFYKFFFNFFKAFTIISTFNLHENTINRDIDNLNSSIVLLSFYKS